MNSVVSDDMLAKYITGCPSYKERPHTFNTDWLHGIVSPVFNEFQLHKIRNDVRYYKHNMLKSVKTRFRLSQAKHKNKGFKEYIEQCVERYYMFFKGAFYNRYKVVAPTLPYDTSVIPLEYNIDGKVDLVMRGSYGITMVNYVFNTNTLNYYYVVAYQATRLQIAARCLKLISGVEPDILCLLLFSKKGLFKRYYPYEDFPYEQHLKILKKNLLPINKNYCHLCPSCTVERCAPWKSKEQVIL